MKDKIAFYGEGFPKAITFLFELQKRQELTAPQVDECLARIEDVPAMRGANLSYFYDTICARDLSRAHTILTDVGVTDTILTDAVQKRDNTGVGIIDAALS